MTAMMAEIAFFWSILFIIFVQQNLIMRFQVSACFVQIIHSIQRNWRNRNDDVEDLMRSANQIVSLAVIESLGQLEVAHDERDSADSVCLQQCRHCVGVDRHELCAMKVHQQADAYERDVQRRSQRRQRVSHQNLPLRDRLLVNFAHKRFQLPASV